MLQTLRKQSLQETPNRNAHELTETVQQKSGLWAHVSGHGQTPVLKDPKMYTHELTGAVTQNRDSGLVLQILNKHLW